MLCGGFADDERAEKMRQDGAAEFISASFISNDKRSNDTRQSDLISLLLLRARFKIVRGKKLVTLLNFVIK